MADSDQVTAENGASDCSRSPWRAAPILSQVREALGASMPGDAAGARGRLQAEVVAADETGKSGLATILNYGHNLETQRGNPLRLWNVSKHHGEARWPLGMATCGPGRRISQPRGPREGTPGQNHEPSPAKRAVIAQGSGPAVAGSEKLGYGEQRICCQP